MYHNLIKRMLSLDPRLRPSAHQVWHFLKLLDSRNFCHFATETSEDLYAEETIQFFPLQGFSRLFLGHPCQCNLNIARITITYIHVINTVRCLFSCRKKFLLQTYISVVPRIMKFIVSYGFIYMKTANRNLELMSEFVSGAGRAVCYCGDERVPNTGRTDRPARSPSCQPPAATRYIFSGSRGRIRICRRCRHVSGSALGIRIGIVRLCSVHLRHIF
jgi:hypothetical protein